MTAPLLSSLLAVLLGVLGYVAGRLHQWRRSAWEREDAYRDGYDEATRSTLSMAARIAAPQGPGNIGPVSGTPGPVSGTPGPVSGNPGPGNPGPGNAGPVSVPGASSGSVAVPNREAGFPKPEAAFPKPEGGFPKPEDAGFPAPVLGKAGHGESAPGSMIGTADAASISSAAPTGKAAPVVAGISVAGIPLPVSRGASSGGAGPVVASAGAGPVVASAGAGPAVAPTGAAPSPVTERGAAAAGGPAGGGGEPGAFFEPVVRDSEADDELDDELTVPMLGRRGRHYVPDELVRATTYRLPPDRVARARVPGALPPEPAVSPAGNGDGGGDDSDEPAVPPTHVPRPRSS